MLVRRAIRLVSDETLLDPYASYLDQAGDFQTEDVLRVAPEDVLLDAAAIFGLASVITAYETALAPVREAYGEAVRVANETATDAINALLVQRDSGQITRAQFRVQKAAAVETKNNAISTQTQALRTTTATERTQVITAVETELNRLAAL